MSFRDITPGRSNKGYAPLNNRNMYFFHCVFDLSSVRPKVNNGEQLSTSIEDIRIDLQNLDKKITELNRMYQNLGTRVDNQQLRTEMFRLGVLCYS